MVEGKGKQDRPPGMKLCHGTGELTAPQVEPCIVLLALPAERSGEKGICQVNSYIPGTRCVHLLKQESHICNGS